MSAEKGGSKADTLVKVVLVFFISLLSFSVGTFVGKQVSDSDHRRMALEGEFKAERSVASTDDKEGDASEKISEKEVESLTEEFVNKEKMAAAETSDHDGTDKHEGEHKEEKAQPTGYKPYNRDSGSDKTADAHGKDHGGTAAHGEEAPATPVAEHGKKKAVDLSHPVADKLAKGKAPSDGAHEERKPASTLPSVAASAVGKYTVQVSAHAEEKEAKAHAADLKGKGWNAFYFPADVQGRTWYRVSVGLFNNFKSATDFRAQFMKDAGVKSAIVQKVVQ